VKTLVCYDKSQTEKPINSTCRGHMSPIAQNSKSKPKNKTMNAIATIVFSSIAIAIFYDLIFSGKSNSTPVVGSVIESIKSEHPSVSGKIVDSIEEENQHGAFAIGTYLVEIYDKQTENYFYYIVSKIEGQYRVRKTSYPDRIKPYTDKRMLRAILSNS